MLDQKDDPKRYPKTQYLTLGPKFFFCNKMTTARRPMDLFEIWDLIPEALVEIYNLAASNQDLKHFSKSDILGFASSVFMDLFPPGGRLNHDDCNLEQFTNILISVNFQNIIRRSPQASPTKNWKIKSAAKEQLRDLSSSSKNFERDTGALAPRPPL